ncbi:MAG: chromosomal replication initiator protein DnaA, partial [Alphaproteobacteria bacterium]
MTDEQQALDAPVLEQWSRVRGRLRAEFGEAQFQSWLKPLSLAGIRGAQVAMSAPTRFLRDWVMSRYADRIRALWSGENPSIRSIAIDIRGGPVAGAAGGDEGVPMAFAASREEQGRPRPPEREAPTVGPEEFGAPLDPRFTFGNFVVGKSNEFAHAAARRMAASDEVPFNPLFLYGGVGLGKTHLMHAIGRHVRARDSSRRVIYMSAEKFMYQFIRALRFKDTMAFKERFRSVDLLMIDDVQFIGGKDSTQEEFFHTFNALVDRNRHVVISCDRSPSDLDRMEERLRSRLGWGLVADIHPTDYELRLGILQAKLEQMGGAEIPQRVLEFLAVRQEWRTRGTRD